MSKRRPGPNTMNERYAVIGHSVRWYREEVLKASLEEFADQVGIPIDVLEQIETGDTSNFLGELIMISLNSDFPLDDVIEDAIARDRQMVTKNDARVARTLPERFRKH